MNCKTQTRFEAVFLLSLVLNLVWCSGVFAQAQQPALPQKQSTPGGELLILDKDGKKQIACPLALTDVQAELAGLSGRVRVRQIFRNPLAQKIEAIYVFPLPPEAAIDDMTMTIGTRKIKGQIKPREEARAIYEAAKSKGQTASLLDQERPNIFTQSIANIAPNAEIVIEISYVETVKFEDGVYEWVFPTVVGPRYMPGNATGKTGSGWSPDTTQVPDASKISPPVAPPSTPGAPSMRTGHDISISVRLNTGDGSELGEVGSTLHPVKVRRDKMGATVSLSNEKEIPNKDFVLRYRLGKGEIDNSFVTQTDGKGRFFSLVLQPPARVTRTQSLPRELIFVLDTSGSMSGFPLEKSKAVMKRALDAMGAKDEFNLITFSGATRVLWESPRANTPQNREEAQKFLDSQQGGGGTEMMKAINTALEGQDAERLRVVCFMTDGYVGNDMAIIDAIQKNAKTARVFSFGIGNSVNRFLLDGMAQAGRGAAEYVLLASDADNAADRFFERINAPVLTDISVDWGDLPVEEIYPKAIPDLFSAGSIVIRGRLSSHLKAGTENAAIITLRGKNAAGAFERRVRVTPMNAVSVPSQNASLPTLWAREKISYLMMQNMAGLQSGSFPKELKDEITALGMEFRLMTQFTSFVAVEEKTVVVDGESLTIAVPVEMPDGVSYQGVFGNGDRFTNTRIPMPMAGSLFRSSNSNSGNVSAGVGFDSRSKIDGFGVAPITPADKLSTPLRDLAAKVEKDGKNGDYNSGDLKVKNYRVRLKIYLREWNDETREAVKKLGLAVSWESADVRFVIGTLDIRKLEELSKIESVVRVEPVQS